MQARKTLAADDVLIPYVGTYFESDGMLELCSKPMKWPELFAEYANWPQQILLVADVCNAAHLESFAPPRNSPRSHAGGADQQAGEIRLDGAFKAMREVFESLSSELKDTGVVEDRFSLLGPALAQALCCLSADDFGVRLSQVATHLRVLASPQNSALGSPGCRCQSCMIRCRYRCVVP